MSSGANTKDGFGQPPSMALYMYTENVGSC